MEINTQKSECSPNENDSNQDNSEVNLKVKVDGDENISNQHEQTEECPNEEELNTNFQQKEFENMSEGAHRLRSWLNKLFRIEMSDGRILTGVFLCTDRDRNIILSSCTEYLPPKQNVEENGLTAEKAEEPSRSLGLVMVPGKHIITIHLDENATQPQLEPTDDEQDPDDDDNKDDNSTGEHSFTEENPIVQEENVKRKNKLDNHEIDTSYKNINKHKNIKNKSNNSKKCQNHNNREDDIGLENLNISKKSVDGNTHTKKSKKGNKNTNVSTTNSSCSS